MCPEVTVVVEGGNMQTRILHCLKGEGSISI